MTDERRPGAPPPLPAAEPADSDTPTEPPPPMPPVAPAAAQIARVPARLGRTLTPGTLTASAIGTADPRDRKATVKIRKGAPVVAKPTPGPPTERVPAPSHMPKPASVPAAPRPITKSTPAAKGRTSAPPPPPLRGPSRTPSSPPRPALTGRPGSVPPPPPTARITDAAIQARLNALETDLRELKRRPSAPPAGAGIGARIERVESRLAVIEEAFSPAFRTLPSRLDALEATIGARVDQVMSAVGRMEVLSARLEESEEELGERLDILQARGEGLERRMKEATGAGGVAEWRDEIQSLRKEVADRWAAESAAQPWRDEIAAIRDLIGAPQKGSGDALAELRRELAELKARPSGGVDEDLKARVTALESMPPPPPGSNLTSVKGIGPKYAKALTAAGVQSPEDIAAWSDEDVKRLAEEVGVSPKKATAWRTAAAKG